MSRRIPSLDGLRGAAALIVVLGHARLIYVQNDPGSIAYADGVRHVLQALGILGNHSVWLFFVLSGLVLSRMMLGARGFDYGAYVLGRVARLYLPVAGAVTFAYATMVMAPRTTAGYGQWVDTHPDAYAVSSVLYDLTLVGGASGNVSPLWSLQWEVLFSLLLVLYVAVSQKVPAAIGAGVAIVAVMVGRHSENPVVMYMAMFAIGSFLAVAWDGITERVRAVEDQVRSKVLYTSAVLSVVVACIGLQLLPMLPSVSNSPSNAVATLATGATMVAIVVVIAAVGLTRPLRALFETRMLHWLGVVSFSLYLTHEPVILAFTYAGDANPTLLLAGLAACFPVAHLFYRLVERPAHRAAQRISRHGLVLHGQPEREATEGSGGAPVGADVAGRGDTRGRVRHLRG